MEEIPMPAESMQRALEILRNGNATWQWYVIPLFALVVYVYTVEMERGRWDIVFAGLALWGMDWFNEVWNSLIFHFNGFAPAWGAPGKTAYLIFVGLNIEICFMFAIAGIVAVKQLPADKSIKVLGIPNRLFYAIANSVFCVFVEIFLNSIGALTWEHSWWNVGAPWLIFLLGYFPFFLVSFWVFDMKTNAQRAKTVGAIFAFDAACIILFAGVLKWI